MAIDKRALVEAVFAGAGIVATNPLPPTVWSYDESAGADAYDPDGAKKLLDEAGVKDLKLKVWAMPVARAYNPDGKKSAEMIKADFARIGVEATVVTFDWGDFLAAPAPRIATARCSSGGPATMATPIIFLRNS